MFADGFLTALIGSPTHGHDVDFRTTPVAGFSGR
jgi:hypothetical protein